MDRMTEKHGMNPLDGALRETIVDDIGRGFVMDDFIMEKKL